jgi:hypothetical protein
MILGCSGNHDLLAQRKVDAGTPVDVTAEDVRGDEGRAVAPTPDVVEASLDPQIEVIDVSEPPEPPGRWTLTWLNGLVDAESAQFCFVPVVGGEEKRDQVILEPAGGLRFGESLVLAELRGVDLSAMDLRPYAVVGGGAGSDAGPGCSAILNAQDGAARENRGNGGNGGDGGDGAARGPVAVGLPLIPAGTLVEGRSYLGVVTGCAWPWPYPDVDAAADVHEAGNDAKSDDASDAMDSGGSRDAPRDADAADGSDAEPADVAMDVFRPPARAAICGASTGLPNAGLVLVRMSQRDVGTNFGFQAVHASTAVAGARIALERAGGSAPVLSIDLGPFQIVPRDGLTSVTRTDFGPSLGAAALRVASLTGIFPAVTVSFASALAASGIDESGLLEGNRLSLVLIGAQPGQNPGPPWNGSRIAVVRNTPGGGGN